MTTARSYSEPLNHLFLVAALVILAFMAVAGAVALLRYRQTLD